MVKVKKGEAKAKVLFLNNQKSTGWEGPFDTSLTMEDMLDFSARLAPRAHTWPASVKESDSSSGEEKSGGSESSERTRSPPFEKGLDLHLEGERGAGYRELGEREEGRCWVPSRYCAGKAYASRVGGPLVGAE